MSIFLINFNFSDDVPPEIKQRRVSEVIDLFYKLAIKNNESEMNRFHLVLVDKDAPRGNGSDLIGRTDTNKKVIFPKIPLSNSNGKDEPRLPKPGDYVAVQIDGTSFTLHAKPLAITTLQEYFNDHNYN